MEIYPSIFLLPIPIWSSDLNWFPGLYELVSDLLEKKVSIKEFIKEVYFEGEGERLQRGYKWKTQNEDHILEVDGAEMGKLEFQMGHSRTLSSKVSIVQLNLNGSNRLGP